MVLPSLIFRIIAYWFYHPCLHISIYIDRVSCPLPYLPTDKVNLLLWLVSHKNNSYLGFKKTKCLIPKRNKLFYYQDLLALYNLRRVFYSFEHELIYGKHCIFHNDFLWLPFSFLGSYKCKCLTLRKIRMRKWSSNTSFVVTTSKHMLTSTFMFFLFI